MSGFRAFEVQADRTLKELTLKGEFQGFDPSSLPLYGTLMVGNIGDPAAPMVPMAPAASGSMPDRTSATITWTAPDNTGRPAITSYVIYRGGVQVGSVNTGVAADWQGSTAWSGSSTWGADGTVGAVSLSFTETGLPTGTPELVFTYTVAAVNSDGVGDLSNAVTLQWQATAVQQPTAPAGLTVGTLTTSQVTLSWAETLDGTVDKHGLFEGSTLVKDNLSASAVSYVWTGLTAGSKHASVGVKRHNSAGWSPVSNLVAFTVPTVATIHDPVMGVPDNDESSALTYQAWPAARIYTFSGVQSAVTKWGCRVVALTDKTTSLTGGATSAAALKAFLEGFYYTSSGAAQNTGVEIHWANGNEVDKNAPYTSGTLSSAFVDTYRQMYNVTRTLNGDGTRRYPKASMWVDLTQHQIKINGSGTRFKAIAQYLDGLGCSMYPPGRQSNPIVFTDYPTYVDPVMTVIQDWHSTYPACNQFATWEFGIPIDHANLTGTANDGTNGEPTAQTNITIRPRYCAGGVDSAGTSWTGFLQYVYNSLDAMSVAMREQCYWNQQSNDVIPNRFVHDKQPRTSPDTEHAWHNWTPGSRLAHG